MAKKKVYLMEHVWMIVALASFVLFVVNTVKVGFSESYLLLIFTAVSLLMSFWRKSIRKKEEED